MTKTAQFCFVKPLTPVKNGSESRFVKPLCATQYKLYAIWCDILLILFIEDADKVSNRSLKIHTEIGHLGGVC